MHASILATMLALTAVVLAPTAASADDRTDCFVIGNTNWDDVKLIDKRLAACTRYIAKAKGGHRAEGYASRGYWYTKKKNYDEALKDFDRALAIDSKNVEFYDYRADVYLAKGEIDLAIDNYNQSIRIDPTYAAAYFSRGKAYEKKGDIDRARESYRAALVPPLERKLAIQKRIQQWAQDSARQRLKELDQPAQRK